jgi:hypothetical protein
MTIDSGSSLSQSETHLAIFENLCRADAQKVKYLINGQLIPRLVKLGVPLQGIIFDWDDADDFSTEERRAIEQMVLQYYDIDPNYFIDQYKLPIIGTKAASLLAKQKDGFDFFA